MARAHRFTLVVLVLAGLVPTSASLSGCDAAAAPTDAGGPRIDAPVPPGTDAPIPPGTDAPIPPGTDGGGGTTGGHLFPDGSWIYQDVSTATLHADSAAITQWLTDNGGWGFGRFQIDFSIPVFEASAGTPYVTRTPGGDWYDPDCDEVAFPIPAGTYVEGEDGMSCTMGGDCHFIVIDRAMGRLFESYQFDYTAGVFTTTCIAGWDMTRVYPPEGRGEQCTSVDAAGFPIAPLLFTPEEIAAGEIDHVIRFILPNARMRAGYYVRPATHAGGPSATDPNAPTYGTRWRLRADYPLASLPNDAARVVARGLQRYGMALSDGGNIALTAANDRGRSMTWADVGLGPRDLDTIQPNDFEVIDTGPPIVLTYDCVRTPY
jgi:serine/threonine-protein kinase